jgi:hypothetical protein
MVPVDSATRWHQWSVKGDSGVLARVIEGLDATHPPGWQRLCGAALESFQSLVRPGSAWYALAAAPAHAAVTLSVEQVRGAELRGGRVWFAAGPGSSPQQTAAVPAGSIPGAWDQIMRFLDEGIVPAARAVSGALVLVPTVEDLFLGNLPIDVADRLRKFSRAARKVLPLDRAETDLWHGFGIGAYRARAVTDQRRMVDWLTSESWKREDAMELSLRFFDQCLLLTRYADEVSAA